ncbi:MAG: YfhO family protein [Chitinophagaceae bacterium]
MNKGLLRKILPHVIAFVIFLLIAVIYCRPSLEGKVLQQHDITQWEGAVHQSQVFREQHGHMPLWTNSMFGGMPAFQIGLDYNNIIPGIVHNVMTLGLPAPAQFFFLASICFYILCIVLGISPWVGILGSLGFAYATYNPVIIVAGHATKMWAMAYMPAVLGSILLIYNKKYWLGTALTGLFTATMIAMNHPQIAYYFFIIVAIMTLFFIVNWIRSKEFKHLLVSLALVLLGGVSGLMVNAGNLLSTYEYQKETIRGDASPLTDTSRSAPAPADGLEKGYAFMYSAYPTEAFVLLVPRMFGGSAGGAEIKGEKSKAIEVLSGLPQELQQQLPMTYYWGGISQDGKFGGTSGPPYSGAIICFLAILSFFVPDGKYKWWALTAIIFSCLMAAGSFLSGFNYFLFDHLPLYNKFRAPSMALVIPQLLLPMLAALGANAIFTTTDKKATLRSFKKGLIATGAVFLVLFLLYFSYDFLNPGDKDIIKQARDANQPQLLEAIKNFFDGLVSDRESLFMTDIFRSLGYILVAATAIFFFLRNSIKAGLAIAVITLFSFIDLIAIDSNYLNEERYQDDLGEGGNFTTTQADKAILADTSYYRVYNVGSDFFQEAKTSYLYNSIGGYHAVKLRLYQDLVQHQFNGRPNMAVLDMLNTKYFIQKDQNGNTTQYQKNPGALGNAWLVKHVQFVKNADAEMAAITSFNPKDTAIVQEVYKKDIPFMPVPDSNASINLIVNLNDQLDYRFQSATNQFAVFSEVYYKSGWKAFIDGKEAPIVKTDYVLRGLAIPAGKHSIQFRFEPQGFITGEKLSRIFTYLLIAITAFAIFQGWRIYNKNRNPENKITAG